MPVLTPEEAAVLASQQLTPVSYGTSRSSPAPLPAPFLSRTPALTNTKSDSLTLLEPGEHTEAVLRELDIHENEVAKLARDGIVGGLGLEKYTKTAAKL